MKTMRFKLNHTTDIIQLQKPSESDNQIIKLVNRFKTVVFFSWWEFEPNVVYVIYVYRQNN